jgi:hypothetical protein
MGFDLEISCRLRLCHQTGTMFFYKSDLTKEYVIPNIVVPEQFRRFINQHGYYLRLYTSQSTDGATSADNFLDKFPEWTEILKDNDYEESWTEEDHNLFKEALEWLVKQPIGFIVSWSF